MNDSLTREYLAVIKQFPDQEVQRSLVRESTVTRVCAKDPSKKPPSAPVVDNLPSELDFLAALSAISALIS